MKYHYYMFIFLLIFLSIIVNISACSMPKKTDTFITIKGSVYDKEFKPYGQIMFNKNQGYIFAARLIQNKDYEIVAINGNNITCIKKITSYPTIMSACNNSFCGGFQYCFNINKKTSYLKNAKYYLYNSEDINCTTKKIKGKLILK